MIIALLTGFYFLMIASSNIFSNAYWQFVTSHSELKTFSQLSRASYFVRQLSDHEKFSHLNCTHQNTVCHEIFQGIEVTYYVKRLSKKGTCYEFKGEAMAIWQVNFYFSTARLYQAQVLNTGDLSASCPYHINKRLVNLHRVPTDVLV